MTGPVAEGKPWEQTNSDHSPNRGSYEFQAALGMVEIAAEAVHSYLEATGSSERVIDKIPTVQGLAKAFLEIADRAQASVRRDGYADRMDSSHVRARGALRTALAMLPHPPIEGTVEERAAWKNDLESYTTAFMQAAARLCDQPYRRKFQDQDNPES